MAPHSSTLAWKIPWTEEPGRLQPMGSQRVGHDWETSLSLFTFLHWRRKWQPTRVLAWRIPGMADPGGLQSMGSQRWTWLKRLCSSSSSSLQFQGWFVSISLRLSPRVQRFMSWVRSGHHVVTSPPGRDSVFVRQLTGHGSEYYPQPQRRN